MEELENKAKTRVENEAELKKYADVIFYDWPNWEEHLKWVCNAPVVEIVEWAKDCE